GDKVDALRLPFTRRREARRGSLDNAWGRLAGLVTRRPAAWVAGVAVLLLALAAPALGMRTALGGIETLPQDLPVVRAYDQFRSAVPTQSGLEVVVRAPASAQEEVTAALLGAADEATALELVSATGEDVERSLDGTVSRWSIGLDIDSSDERLADVVEEVRAEVLPAVSGSLADVRDVAVHLGGEAAVSDLTSWMDGKLPWVVGFVLVLTLVVMAVSFGSPALALATVALNALSVAAAYGIMTLVFGGAGADGRLDFTSAGSIAAWL